jgi:type VI protein secretion system component VasF
MDEFEKLSQDLAKQIEQEGKVDSAAQNAVNAINQLRHHRDRSFIGRAVISLYVGVVAAMVLYLLWSHDDHTFSNLSELLKVSVLPVVTLAIGYYFGTAKSE